MSFYPIDISRGVDVQAVELRTWRFIGSESAWAENYAEVIAAYSTSDLIGSPQ